MLLRVRPKRKRPGNRAAPKIQPVRASGSDLGRPDLQKLAAGPYRRSRQFGSDPNLALSFLSIRSAMSRHSFALVSKLPRLRGSLAFFAMRAHSSAFCQNHAACDIGGILRRGTRMRLVNIDHIPLFSRAAQAGAESSRRRRKIGNGGRGLRAAHIWVSDFIQTLHGRLA